MRHLYNCPYVFVHPHEKWTTILSHCKYFMGQFLCKLSRRTADLQLGWQSKGITCPSLPLTGLLWFSHPHIHTLTRTSHHSSDPKLNQRKKCRQWLLANQRQRMADYAFSILGQKIGMQHTVEWCAKDLDICESYSCRHYTTTYMFNYIDGLKFLH